MYRGIRKLILELREDAQHKLEQHTRKCQEYDKKAMYAEYMSERTMQAYCRGRVQAFNHCLEMIDYEEEYHI